MQQRRQHDRQPVLLEVSFEVDGERVQARSRDISLGGMFIETDRTLPYGTRLAVDVKLPALPAPVTIDATVRWLADDGMGVQFGTLRARETWAINQIVRS